MPRSLFDTTLPLPSRVNPAHVSDAEAASKAAYPVIDDYELLAEIARGGMGVVYRARQRKVGRIVALKMVLPAVVPDEEAGRRFQIEAEAAARLDHPNIVPIYDVGTHSGQPYFTMKLIEGGSLLGELGELTANCRCGVQIMAHIARAVDYAHQRGILHRDLKPGNILVDEQGWPYLTDFGLAKYANRDSSLTVSGAVMGTPAFMAPEQASGGAKEVTTAADIYSLGAILYLLLTGQPPFHSEVALEILRRVVDEEPERPSSINRRVDKDLETICLKCLEKEPHRRYGTAGGLAEDLERWLRGEPIAARPSTGLEQLVKWAKRKPAIATLTAALAAALIVGFAATFQQWRHAEAARVTAVERANAATKAQQEMEKQRARAEEALTKMKLQRAEEYFETFDTTEALRLLRDVIQSEPTNRVAKARLASALSFRNFVQATQPALIHNGTVNCARFSPDGKRVATASSDKTACLWDTETRKQIGLPLRHDGVVTLLEFSPDGQRLLTASKDGFARLWSTSDGHLIASMKHGGEVLHASFGENGEKVITTSDDRTARVWNGHSGEPLTEPLLHQDRVIHADLSSNGRFLLTCTGQELRVWELIQKPLLLHTIQLTGVAYRSVFSPDGKRFATGCRDGTMRVWETATGQPTTKVFGHRAEIESLTFSPDGHRLLSSSGDRTACLWDPVTGTAAAKPFRHAQRVYHAEFAANGKSLVTVSSDGVTRIWHALTGEPLSEQFQHPGEVRFASISSDGSRVVTCASDGRSLLWPVSSHTRGRVDLRHGSEILAEAVSPKGDLVATAASSKTSVETNSIWSVKIWNLMEDSATEIGTWTLQSTPKKLWWSRQFKTFECLTLQGQIIRIPRTGSGHPQIEDYSSGETVIQSDATPDGSRLIVAGTEKVRIWNRDEKTLAKEILVKAAPGDVLQLGSQGGKFALRNYNEFQLWDSQALPPSKSTLATKSIVWFSLFSSDDQLLFSSVGGTPKMWNTDSVRNQTMTQKSVNNVVIGDFASDGQTLLLGTSDGIVAVESVRNPEKPLLLLKLGSSISKVKFMPNGTRIITATLDGAVRIWDVATGLPLSENLAHLGEIESLQFAPDTKRLLVRVTGGQISVHNFPDWPN